MHFHGHAIPQEFDHPESHSYEGHEQVHHDEYHYEEPYYSVEDADEFYNYEPEDHHITIE